MAMLVAALFTLGATIVGPAVLTLEYEPVPRGFAIGLIFLAIGLVAHEHLMLADIAAAAAFFITLPPSGILGVVSVADSAQARLPRFVAASYRNGRTIRVIAVSTRSV